MIEHAGGSLGLHEGDDLRLLATDEFAGLLRLVRFAPRFREGRHFPALAARLPLGAGSFYAAALLAALGAGLLGLVVEIGLLRRVYRAPELYQLLATFALVLVDSSDGLVEGDLAVADEARKAGCATLVVLSKWDITTVDIEDVRERMITKLRQRPAIITTSALTGRNVDRLLDAVDFSEQYGEVCPANWKKGEKAMKPTAESLKQYMSKG